MEREHLAEPVVAQSVVPRPVVRWPWLPRSWAAGGVFLLTAVIVAGPVVIVAFMTLITYSGCFMDCSTPNHAGGVALGVLDLGLAALPFLAVRIFQGLRRRSARGALGIVVAFAAVLIVSFRPGGLFPW